MVAATNLKPGKSSDTRRFGLATAPFRAGPSDVTGPYDAADDSSQSSDSAPEPDLAAATQAANAFLHALGMPLRSEGQRDTPRRMAQAYAEFLTAAPFTPTTRPNSENYDELVITRDIPLRSLCEHHMLPITGMACVGYLPGERIVGSSEPARAVEYFAGRPQTQERLTKQLADSLEQQLRPRAVGVVIRAEHSCMTLRGVHAAGSTTITSTLLGTLRSDPDTRHEFLALAGVGTASTPYP